MFTSSALKSGGKPALGVSTASSAAVIAPTSNKWNSGGREDFPAALLFLDENADIGITAGIFATYLLLRYLLTLVATPKKQNPAAYRTAAAASRTFFIILTLFLLATGGILAFIDVNLETIRNAMIWISMTIYFIFIIRKIQIFASSYNFFTVFLYLCALEIIPTGVLVTSAMIL